MRHALALLWVIAYGLPVGAQDAEARTAQDTQRRTAQEAQTEATARDDRAEARAAQNARAEARELFAQADALLMRGRFAEARDLLLRSFEAFPAAPTAFNLAVASRGVGRSVDAVAWLDRLAAGEVGALDATRLAEVRALRAEVEREVATLTIDACGGDATEVRLDGEVWERFDGCRRLERGLDAGSYVIEVSSPRHVSLRRRVFASRGAAPRLSVRLEPVPTGQLVVRVPDDEVVVEVEGVGRGIGGFRRELPVGPYRVSAAMNPARPEVRRVNVEAGQLLEVEFGRRARLRRRRAGVAAAVLGVVAGALVVGFISSRDTPYRDPVFGRTET